MMRLIGDYHYASSKLDGIQYAVIWNGDIVERVRVITPTGNPIIWETGEPLTDIAIAAISAAEVKGWK